MDLTLYDWAAQVTDALELPQEARWVADRDTVTWTLDLARDVAHGVARPAAPVATFLAGVAVGLAAGAGDRDLLAETRAKLAGALATPVNVDP